MTIPTQSTDGSGHDPATPSTDPSSDPADFDLDAWIGAVDRPEAVVELYNPDPADWLDRYTDLQAQHSAASAKLRLAVKQAEDGAEVSILDDGPAVYEAQLDDLDEKLLALRDERRARALLVTIRQMTPDEMAASFREAAELKVPQAEQIVHVIAGAIVAMTAPGPDGTRRPVPPFTTEQLIRFSNRDVSGHAGFIELRDAVNTLSRRPSVPSWPGSSTSRGTGTSSAR